MTTVGFNINTTQQWHYTQIWWAHITSVAPHVDFEPTGLVVDLSTAWVRACVVASFSEVSAIVGEQGAKSDEGLFTSCRTQI